jgi:tetratricopeptide (TPR) repeat protein
MVNPNGNAAALVRIALSLLVLFLSSCTLRPAETALFRGNYAFERGEYQDATVQYLAALDSDGEAQLWVKYNLGNVYFSVGEVESAMTMWESAARTDDSDLLFAVNYNRGVACYRQGDFKRSFSLFRDALLLRPDDRDTKVNLELAQRKLQAEELLTTVGTVPGGARPAPAVSAEAGRLYDFVIQKEASRSRQSAPSSSAPARGGEW